MENIGTVDKLSMHKCNRFLKENYYFEMNTLIDYVLQLQKLAYNKLLNTK